MTRAVRLWRLDGKGGTPGAGDGTGPNGAMKAPSICAAAQAAHGQWWSIEADEEVPARRSAAMSRSSR